MFLRERMDRAREVAARFILGITEDARLAEFTTSQRQRDEIRERWNRKLRSEEYSKEALRKYRREHGGQCGLAAHLLTETRKEVISNK